MAIQKPVSRKSRLYAGGFTVFEYLVVIFLVAILVVVALPYYFGAENKLKEAGVRLNMHRAQIAAETYASDSGNYPSSSLDAGYRAYFPGGNKNLNSPSGGIYPVNPFTSHPEPLQTGSVTDVEAARKQSPKNIGAPGQVFYNPISDSSGVVKSYAIMGADKSGKALSGTTPNTTMVLSNK